MLSLAMAKLQEALEIIDHHGAHLPGIHVANAIAALGEVIYEDDLPTLPVQDQVRGHASN